MLILSEVVGMEQNNLPEEIAKKMDKGSTKPVKVKLEPKVEIFEIERVSQFDYNPDRESMELRENTQTQDDQLIKTDENCTVEEEISFSSTSNEFLKWKQSIILGKKLASGNFSDCPEQMKHLKDSQG